MANRTKISINFNLNKSYVSKEGKSAIQVRIGKNGKRVTIPCGLSISTKLWGNGQATGSSTEARQINQRLSNIRKHLEDTIEEMEGNREHITLQGVKDRYLGKGFERITLMEYYGKFIAKMKKKANAGMLSPKSVGRYENAMRHVTNYLKKHYKKEDVYFSELNLEFINNLELYLRSEAEKPLSINVTARYIKYLKTVVNEAIKDEVLHKDPFVKYKLKTEEKPTTYLDSKELKRLMEKEFDIQRLDEVRDVFVFCCYTGLSYRDAEKLTSKYLKEDQDGRVWIDHKRIKSGVESNIPLLAPALVILEKYRDRKDPLRDGKLLPMKSNQKYNAFLKEVAVLCGITKHLTTHVARHTFATLMISNGASIEATAKMLGHKKIQTTQHYAKILREKLVDEMDVVSKNLQKKGLLA